MINNQNLAVLSEKVAYLESAVTNSNEASEISYDNTNSGLTADDVQEAIDELAPALAALTAAGTSYNNTESGLTADDVQEAIDEVNTKTVKKKSVTYSNISNSDETKYYVTLTTTPLVDIDDDATEILGLSVTGFNGYLNLTDKILPNAVMDSGKVVTLFEKGKTFSNISLDITYMYR